MLSDLLSKELVQLDVDAADWEDAIKKSNSAVGGQQKSNG